MTFGVRPGPIFPSTRLRRNRKNDWVRRLTAETKLSVDDLIWPTFVVEGSNQSQSVDSMPGVYRYSIDILVDQISLAEECGIPLVAIFPQIDDRLKHSDGREAINPENLLCRAVREVKRQIPNIGVLCDVALDPYNSDGHDGIFRDGKILNDETLDILGSQAIVQAEAGCDIIGPSDMMDGRIGFIRSILDQNNFGDVNIMAYSAKYASAFYGPFRDAIGSSNALKGDKKTYQMDFRNLNEAFREIGLDIKEGADMVMVKPGLPYLDIIKNIKDNFRIPVFAYQVSGEYSLIKYGIKNKLINDGAILESLMAFKRAGASAIVTYFALEIADRIKKS